MSSLTINLQRTDRKTRAACFDVRNGAAQFYFEHGDQWPKDVGRKDKQGNPVHHDRVELSMKAGPKPYRCWFYGCHTFEYTVATDWRSVACRSGEGNIKLGQLHSVEPLFSLRWAPKSPVDRMRLWMDFITCHEGQTDVKVSLDDMIDALEDGIPLRVRIRTTPHGCTLRLLVTVEAIGLDGEPMAERAARCTTFPGQLDRAGSDALRFKIGAYRKNEGDTPWSKMKISYTDIRIDGTVLSDSQLQDAKEI